MDRSDHHLDDDDDDKFDCFIDDDDDENAFAERMLQGTNALLISL